MRYVVVAAPPDVVEPADLVHLPAAADVVELRLDLLARGLTRAGARRWLRAALRAGQARLVTVRSTTQGGRSALDPLGALRLCWEGGPPQAVDVEARLRGRLARWLAGGALPEPPPGWWVVSRHDGFRRTRLAGRLAGGVVKCAGHVADARGLARYLTAVRRPARGRARALLPTGPLGALRVLDAGAALLYGSAGHAVVAGQPTLLALLDELRAGEVSPRAHLFGLLGRPPAPSPSPALHNAAFRALDRDAVHVPLPGLSLPRALTLPFHGYSVTAPWKRAALARARTSTAAARAAGAANTLVRRADGRWHAHNTDVEALAEHLRGLPRGSTLVVHGAGGYARAALAAGRACGLNARLVARDARAGARLARAFSVAFEGARWLRQDRDAALVNATPAGAVGEPIRALDADLEGLVVLDAPYAPEGARTWLAQAAAQRGARRVVDGLALLLSQARGQARAFLGPRHASSLASDVLWWALRPRTNLVLVGLRGAGKTRVAHALARRLGRPCVDLDAEVLRRTGRDAADFLRDPLRGLADFRRAESLALRALEGRRGLVIATGGGVIENARHAPILARLGPCVWLDVPAHVAAQRVSSDPRPRPPLGDDATPLAEALRLLARRRPLYARVADLRVDARRTPDEVVAQVAAFWTARERRARGEDFVRGGIGRR